MDTPRKREPGPSPALSFVISFLPIAAWGYLLGVLANADPEAAWLTALVLSVAFAAGLLILKPLVLLLGVVAVTRWLWSLWRKREMDGRWEMLGARAIGLLYAPLYGLIALAVGVWDGWSPGGMSPVAAALVFGAAGFVHALAVHRHTAVAAFGLLVIIAGGEADGGGESAPRRMPPERDAAPPAPPAAAEDG